MNLTKLELRKLLKTKRLELNPAERATKSDLIVSNLNKALDWSNLKAVHVFEPILELGEVDISKFSGNDNLFTSRKIENKWQVVSLNGNAPVPDGFDAVIVPMLGFDSKLHRIGYGGGYYDKFLATQPRATKIGVCFETGHVDYLPTEPHDVALDLVITESKIYK